MGRAGWKHGLSDPAVLDGKAVAQQIKGTPGITGLSPLSVHSGEEVWHLNTSGCCTSDRAPTNRLITVKPYLDCGSDSHDSASCPGKRMSKRRYRGKSKNRPSPPATARWQVWAERDSHDPVTTDPKGKAPAFIRCCNTPTPATTKRDYATNRAAGASQRRRNQAKVRSRMMI